MDIRWASVLSSAAIAIACGGSSDSGLSGTGGVASGGSAGGGDKYPLAEVCAKLAPIGCGYSKGCCEQSGFGYDENGCVQHAIADCEKNVAEVNAGTMTYDANQIDACLPAFEKLLNQCVIGF